MRVVLWVAVLAVVISTAHAQGDEFALSGQERERCGEVVREMPDLVCANELGEAAELYVQRLGDPMARTAALVALQRWAPAPGRMRSRDAILQRLESVQSRREVQQALAVVGQTLEIPLPIAYWANRY